MKTQQRPTLARGGHPLNDTGAPLSRAIARSLLNFWCLPTTVQPAIWTKNAVEGEDVHLRIRNMPPEAKRVMWYRGEGVNKDRIIAFLVTTSKYHLRGPAYGPVTINYDGSLLLKNVTIKDTGMYSVTVQQDSKTLTGFAQLNVFRHVKVPALRATNTTVTENKDAVVFTCYSNAMYIQWLFNGKQLQFTERMKLTLDHRRLKIDPVKREDAGIYQCKASNPISATESTYVKLDVKTE
ncbi:carcinoembryonic antigen-related cell adhesion molecule 21-like [Pteronotus mesoamericanus]|uniref:carcinoembryonic antigen-related cell adhesion molecule 21-like n=1 Tax=Pteronotus mesoamericanus TaxID=1884717 RepID=UPI0023EDCE7A|nr:carcinoembryonic antigen-related cell adhesion molecule 21-like [Pteronotus parnellii mesoamericanus]